MLTHNTFTATQRKAKRVWRGGWSWKGTFSGRGCKWQNARAGGGTPDWFEGWQTPLFRRMPKLKGFSNSNFKIHYNVVNLDSLESLAKLGITVINTQVLLDAKIIRRKSLPVKVLGSGAIVSKIELTTDSISESAKIAIEKAWGTITFSPQEAA